MTAQDNRPPRPERVVLSENGTEIIGMVEWRGGNPARPWRAYLLGVGYLSMRYTTPEQAAEAVRRGQRLNSRALTEKQRAVLHYIAENGPLRMSPRAYRAAGATDRQITTLLQRGMLRAVRTNGAVCVEATGHGRQAAEQNGASHT